MQKLPLSYYYFVDSDTERDKHRANAEYLNFGTTEIGKGKAPAIVKNTEKIKSSRENRRKRKRRRWGCGNISNRRRGIIIRIRETR